MRPALGQVGDIQADRPPFGAVLDGEIEPLKVAPRVGVNSEEKVILVLTYFDNAVQVSRLEAGLK